MKNISIFESQLKEHARNIHDYNYFYIFSKPTEMYSLELISHDIIHDELKWQGPLTRGLKLDHVVIESLSKTPLCEAFICNGSLPLSDTQCSTQTKSKPNNSENLKVSQNHSHDHVI